MNRKVLFTDHDSHVKVIVDLPGKHILDPPTFLQFRGKLYKAKGGGVECNFYHVVDNFHIVEEKE